MSFLARWARFWDVLGLFFFFFGGGGVFDFWASLATSRCFLGCLGLRLWGGVFCCVLCFCVRCCLLVLFSSFGALCSVLFGCLQGYGKGIKKFCFYLFGGVGVSL